MKSIRPIFACLVILGLATRSAALATGPFYAHGKLDLIPPSDPLGIFEALGLSDNQDLRAASSAFTYRFDAGNSSKGAIIWGPSANAALFSLAVINAFIPRWLPKNVSRVLNGQGHPGGMGVSTFAGEYHDP